MAALRKFLYVVFAALLVLLIPELLLRNAINDVRTPPIHDEAVDPATLLFTANDIRFETEDHQQLQGWLIHGKPGFPVFVLAHNFGSNRSELLGKLEGLVTTL